MIEVTGKYTNAVIMIDDVESSCMSQIVAMTNHPAFTEPIRIMPDTHAGKGAVIGFTMPLGNKIIPNVVGVDISCGMLSFEAGTKLFDNMTREDLDVAIRERIPFGSNVREHKHPTAKFDWKLINEEIRLFTLKFNKRFDMNMAPVVMDNESLIRLMTKVGCDASRAINAIGTLGGGNHFIEIGKDERDMYWITIHSGSRNFGKCVAEYHQKVAVQRLTEPIMPKDVYITQVKDLFPKKKWHDEIAKFEKFMSRKSYVPKGTEYLEGEDMYAYLVDMMIAQKYADISRYCMAQSIQGAILSLDDTALCPVIETVPVSSVHNFIDFDDWVIRKGAIRSYKGERMVIPWNMEQGLIIAVGKTNPEWNNSAPHGAGRLFSRSHAKKTLSLKQAKADMAEKDIYSSGIPLDEVRAAYKDPLVIEVCVEPTLDIIHRVIPVMNMKDK